MTPLLGGALLITGCAPAGGAPGSSSSPSVSPSAPKLLRLGVQSSNEPSGGTEGPVSPAPYGGSGSGSPSLEHFFTFHSNLTMFDVQSNIVPLAAQKVPSINDGDWKLTPDGGMEVTWKIKPEAKWHDGKPLTAEDFQFGYMVFKDPDLPHTPRGELASITEIRIVDPQTFVAVWKTQSILGNNSAYDGIPVLAKHVFGPLWDAGDKTGFENSALWNEGWIGLGPYRLTRWEKGSFIEGTAFDQFFLGRPKIDRVQIKYIGDVNALIANVLSGDIDVIPLGAQLDVPQMVTVRDAWKATDGGLTIAIPKGVRTAYLQFKDPNAPWVKDQRIRQALFHASDRDTFVEVLLSGLTSRADYFATPDEPAYKLAQQRNVPNYPYDLTRVERLMTEAGYTRGSDRQFRNAAGEPVHIDVTSSNQGANVQEASTLASGYSQAGFQSIPTPYPAAADNASEIRHKAPGALIWPYNFSLTVIKTFTQSEIGTDANRYRGGNYPGWTSPTYESEYNKLINTFDQGQRNEVMFGLVKTLAEEIPAIPIFFTPLCLVARKGIEGPGMTSPMQAGNAWNIYAWDIKS
jgi:peptide/nickel transport system substrate-binding protein